MEIRYRFIEKSILELFKALPTDLLAFPLDVIQIVEYLDNCKILSYQSFAKINQIDVEKTIEFCESESGCTHYCADTKRYLVLYNKSYENHNVQGRQKFTLSHELGHVRLNHLPSLAEDSIAENNFNNITNPFFEKEANYFATTFLAPLPLFKMLNIHSPSDIKNTFGLSTMASQYRYNDYVKWKNGHIKTAWENDMVKLFKKYI